ncbi:MAG: hypothetical protein ACXAB4_00085 [Candidatus Hodarchaeales archaeon]
MPTAFCEDCGTVLLIRKRNAHSSQTEIYCPKCKIVMDSESSDQKSAFVEEFRISHSQREETLILDEKAPPPIPLVMNVTKLGRRRCRHKNAVFQGSYQFGRGDEPSRSYWMCNDCGQLFRFGGRFKDLGSELSKKQRLSRLSNPSKGNKDL